MRVTSALTRIGVLALQGAFREHACMLASLGVEAVEVRTPGDLEGCRGLVLPGGETTAQRKLAKAYGLWEPLRTLGRAGLPMLATCAGLILLSRSVEDGNGYAPPRTEPGEEVCLGLMDIHVARNAYGRQVHSFEADLDVPCLASVAPADRSPFRAVFIRAPVIRRTGPAVSVLCARKGSPVAVEQGNLLALAFHPELTRDDRFHRYFLERVLRHPHRPFYASS